MMDAEKRLLLLHLKSDLKEILKLARVKSEEMISSFSKGSDKSLEMAEDLEYYISSLLDITREMKVLFDSDKALPAETGRKIDLNTGDFDEFLRKLSGPEDAESLREILTVLENWEFYELCDKVNRQLLAVTTKAG